MEMTGLIGRVYRNDATGNYWKIVAVDDAARPSKITLRDRDGNSFETIAGLMVNYSYFGTRFPSG